MPWSGSAPNQSFSRTDGTRTGDTVWQDAKTAGVKIVADDHDTHDTDVGDAIDACLKKDGGNTATGDIPLGNFRITGLGNATAATDALNRQTADARYLGVKSEIDIASATTTNIGAAAGVRVRITGTTTITAFDTVAAGITRVGKFADILTLTHNATSLILPGGSSIITAANDRFQAVSLGSGNWLVEWYARADGIAIVVADSTPSGHISGLLFANNVTDPTNDLDIAVGVARDSTDAKTLRLISSLTKRLDASWAVGTNQGGLDTGSRASGTWYYVWLIMRSDTGVVDALFSTSANLPTMPANYDYKRLIGMVYSDGTNSNMLFTAFETESGGIEYRYTTPLLDINLSNTLTTSRRTDNLTVPALTTLISLVHVLMNDATSTFSAVITSVLHADQAPSTTVSPLATHVPLAAQFGTQLMHIPGSQIAARANLATVDSYRVATLGFRWIRR